MALLVDVHCHINHAYFKDKLDEVLARADQAGVKAIVAAGVNGATNREILTLAKKHPVIKPALGLYPLDALNVESDAPDELGLARQENLDVDKELKFIEEHKDDIVAIGEVGLDYQDASRSDEQKVVFSKIIALAKKIDKTLVVHSRKAESDVIAMLKEAQVTNAVLHCFGGRKSLVKEAVAAGLSFSIPAIVKRLKHFEMIIDFVPLNQLLTETDAPWLSPELGRQSEPADVIYSIRKIAEIKGVTEEEVAKNIFFNYQRLFL